MIRLNELAPDFTAKSTHGPLQLSDYRGKWVVLFSHPADFTPVCTSEFVSFARRSAEFEALNCTLIGLSVDSVYSHIAWARSIGSPFIATGGQYQQRQADSSNTQSRQSLCHLTSH